MSYNVTPGSIRFNTDSMKLEYYHLGSVGFGTLAAGEWVQITTDTPDIQTGGTRGLVASGNTNSDKIEFVNLATTGTFATFGDISGTGGAYRNGTADRTRAVFFNAQNATDSQFVTIASTGNSASFATMPNDYNQAASCSDGIRGFRVGGSDAGVTYANIYQIIFQTTGEVIDWGDLSVNRLAFHGNMNSTRAVFHGGSSPGSTDGVASMEFITMATQGTGSDFGDMIDAGKHRMAGCNSVRGLIAGGSVSNSAVRNIEYITLSTLGNAISFGDLGGTANAGSNGACSSPTRALFASVGNNNTTNYAQIMHEGDAVQFSDLGLGRNYAGTTSNGHGGLG